MSTTDWSTVAATEERSIVVEELAVVSDGKAGALVLVSASATPHPLNAIAVVAAVAAAIRVSRRLCRRGAIGASLRSLTVSARGSFGSSVMTPLTANPMTDHWTIPASQQ
jgi:hypothetical protein